MYNNSVVKIPEAHIKPLAVGILNTYAPIYQKRKIGWINAAIIAILESVEVIKQRRHAGACREILSQQFWWHQTALLPKEGNSSNRALGADIFSTEYPALTLPIVNGIIDNKTTPTDRQRLQAKATCIWFK